MSCFPKCLKTASHDNQGHRIMVSVAGNKKYPVPNTTHPQCESCMADEIEHAKLMILFNNDMGLVKQYQALKKKVEENAPGY